MIKGLSSSSKYTVVSSGNTSVPYINSNTSNPIQGMLRICGSDLQVFDGTSWIVVNSSYATVGLTPDAELLLDWARQKRDEEIIKSSETNPVIKDLLDKIDIYKDQIKMIKILMKDEVKI